jgi:hypothetical protein
MEKSPIARGWEFARGSVMALGVAGLVTYALRKMEKEQSKHQHDLEANKNAWKPMFPELEEPPVE